VADFTICNCRPGDNGKDRTADKSRLSASSDTKVFTEKVLGPASTQQLMRQYASVPTPSEQVSMPLNKDPVAPSTCESLISLDWRAKFVMACLLIFILVNPATSAAFHFVHLVVAAADSCVFSVLTWLLHRLFVQRLRDCSVCTSYFVFVLGLTSVQNLALIGAWVEFETIPIIVIVAVALNWLSCVANFVAIGFYFWVQAAYGPASGAMLQVQPDYTQPTYPSHVAYPAGQQHPGYAPMGYPISYSEHHQFAGGYGPPPPYVTEVHRNVNPYQGDRPASHFGPPPADHGHAYGPDDQVMA
jgi:hypothetical protein